MSNMFRGTMMKKTPAANVAIAMSLEELDRPTYCPENVDEDSWKHLCKIRRDKIASEERIQALEADIAETDQVRTRKCNLPELNNVLLLLNLLIWLQLFYDFSNSSVKSNLSKTGFKKPDSISSILDYLSALTRLERYRNERSNLKNIFSRLSENVKLLLTTSPKHWTRPSLASMLGGRTRIIDSTTLKLSLP